MMGAVCKLGETYPGHTNVVFQRGNTTVGNTTVVIKDVPADVCDNSDEYCLSENVTRRVLELGEAAVAHGAEFEVLRFEA